MAFLALAIALAALTSANPLPSPQSYTTVPPPSPLPLSKSFKLFINVTNRALDFPTHPVHGLYLTTVRAGATLNAPTVTNTSSPLSLAAVFSTTTRQTTQLSHTFNQTAYSVFMAESATPAAANPHVLNLGVNAGNGTEGIYTSGNECTRLATEKVGTFAVCDERFDAYTHPRWLVVFVEGGEENLPGDGSCVAVGLVPECDAFDPEPGVEGGKGRVVEARCWEDVKAVENWGAYGC